MSIKVKGYTNRGADWNIEMTDINGNLVTIIFPRECISQDIKVGDNVKIWIEKELSEEEKLIKRLDKIENTLEMLSERVSFIGKEIKNVKPTNYR